MDLRCAVSPALSCTSLTLGRPAGPPQARALHAEHQHRLLARPGLQDGGDWTCPHRRVVWTSDETPCERAFSRDNAAQVEDYVTDQTSTLGKMLNKLFFLTTFADFSH